MGPDEIIRWPTEELLEPAHGPISLRENAAIRKPGYPERPGAYVAPARRRRRPSREQIDPALDLFAGFTNLLFRTALIRTEDWREGDVGPEISTFEAVVDLLRHMSTLDHEHVVTLCLDGRNRLIAIHQTAVGGLHGAAVMARDIHVPVLLVRASAFVIAHNPPSGDPSPSPEDVMMTRAVSKVAEVVGVALLDHVIIGGARTGRVQASSLLELGAISHVER